MNRKAQLQFRLMAPEAQRSAIRRLALSGLDDQEISDRTGWMVADIRDVLSPPMVSAFMPWAMNKVRRSGSSGGSLRS